MRTTVTLSDELAAHVDEVRSSADDSDAEAMRECVRRSQRLDKVENELESLQEDLNSKQARIDDLQRQLMAANQRIETTNELVERVDSEMSAREKKQRASITTRAKWWLFGMGEKD